MRGRAAKTAIIILGVLAIMGILGFLSGKRYAVDCPDHCIEGGRTKFRPGETVTLRFPIMTDTSFSLYLDGELQFPEVSEDGSDFIYTFAMPSHDVKVTWTEKNLMIAEDRSLVFSYSEAVTATVGGDSSLDISVYETYGGDLVMEVISNGSEPYDYPFSPYALERLDAIVEQYGMGSWDDLTEYECLDGKVYSCVFSCGGALISVSSGKMPPDGLEAFRAVEGVLSCYMGLE